jgi:hypothetical protein
MGINEVVIVSGCRIAIEKFLGSLNRASGWVHGDPDYRYFAL